MSISEYVSFQQTYLTPGPSSLPIPLEHSSFQSTIPYEHISSPLSIPDISVTCSSPLSSSDRGSSPLTNPDHDSVYSSFGGGSIEVSDESTSPDIPDIPENVRMIFNSEIIYVGIYFIQSPRTYLCTSLYRMSQVLIPFKSFVSLVKSLTV